MAANTFWDALEASTKANDHFADDRQRKLQAAERRVARFADDLNGRESYLSKYGLIIISDRYSISFKKSNLEILSVNFNVDNGSSVRIFSPVVEYLKLSPSYEDVHISADVEAKVGQWLGRSLNAVEENRDMFQALGLL